MTNRHLSPYDTGDRLQPKIWVNTHPDRFIEDDLDRYGKIDLDNDESTTEMVVWGQRGKDGGYELHCYSMGEEVIPVVQHHTDRVFQVVAEPLPKDHMLGLREVLGSAETDGHQISYSHGFGFGNLMLAIEVTMAGGERVSESIKVESLLQKWAAEIIREQTREVQS